MNRIVVKDDGCWQWIGSRNQVRGEMAYGVVRWGGPQRYVHRVLYEHIYGPYPGLDTDHLCRNRACVNPAHLEPVTRQENILRAPVRGRRRKMVQ